MKEITPKTTNNLNESAGAETTEYYSEAKVLSPNDLKKAEAVLMHLQMQERLS